MSQLDVLVRLLAVDATAGAFGSFNSSLGNMTRGLGDALIGMQQLGSASQGMAGRLAEGDVATAGMVNSLGLLSPATAASIAGLAGIRQASTDAGNAVALSGRNVSSAQKEYDSATAAVLKAQMAYDAASPALLRFGGSSEETALRQAKLAQLSNDVSAAFSRQNNALAGLTGAQIAQRDADDAAELAAAREAAVVSNLSIATAELTSSMMVLAGATLGTGAATALIGTTMSDAYSQASDLQFSLATLGVASLTTGGNLDVASKSIQRVADTSLYTTSEVGNAYERLIERGQSMTDVINHSGQAAINLGEAIHTDAVPAADLLGITMREFGLSADQSAHASDVLTTAFYSGIPSADQLAQGIRQLAPVARSAGAGFEDTMSVLSLLGGAFGSGSQAATALRYMMMQLVSPTNKAADELQQLGMVTINSANPAIAQLHDTLEKSGKAGKAAADGFDGSYAALNLMWTAGKKNTALDLGGSFAQWGMATHVLSSDLFDASGNFKGMSFTVQELKTKLDALPSTEVKLEFLRNLFSIRGEQAAALLETMDHLGTDLNTVSTNMHKAGVASGDAARLLDTNRGSMAALDTTWKSFLANVGAGWLPIIDPVIQSFTRLLFVINQDAPALARFLAVALPIGFVFGLAVTVITAFSVVMTLLGPMLAGAGIGLATVAATAGAVASGFGIVLAAGASVAATFFVLNAVFTALNRVGTPLNAMVNGLEGFLHNLGGYVGGIFLPLWNNLVVVFGNLLGSLSFLTPLFGFLGQAIGGIAIFALITGLTILAATLIAIITIVSVVVQSLVWFATAIIDLVHTVLDGFSTIGGVISDFLHGNWSALKNDWHGGVKLMGDDMSRLGSDTSKDFASIAGTFGAGNDAMNKLTAGYQASVGGMMNANGTLTTNTQSNNAAQVASNTAKNNSVVAGDAKAVASNDATGHALVAQDSATAAKQQAVSQANVAQLTAQRNKLLQAAKNTDDETTRADLEAQAKQLSGQINAANQKQAAQDAANSHAVAQTRATSNEITRLNKQQGDTDTTNAQVAAKNQEDAAAKLAQQKANIERQNNADVSHLRAQDDADATSKANYTAAQLRTIDQQASAAGIAAARATADAKRLAANQSRDAEVAAATDANRRMSALDRQNQSDATASAQATQHAVTSAAQQTADNAGRSYEDMHHRMVSSIVQAHDEVTVAMNGLANSALLWGEHTGGNFAAGLSSTYNLVLSAASGIANTVSRVLAHTRPLEGPLSEGEEIWGIHLVENLIRGIDSKLPDLQGIVHGMATTLSQTPQMALNTQQQAQYASAQGNIIVTVPIDGKPIAQVVIDRVTAQIKQGGATRFNK